METVAPTVIDDFAPRGLVNAALAEWPDASWRHWHVYSGEHSVKRATKDAARLPRAAMMLIEQVASMDVPEGCFPDLELHGAGLHEIPDGGHLGKHLDGAIHPVTGWKREQNAVLFLNDDFFGGELMFFRPDGSETHRVTPAKNRLVMFSTSDEAWHTVAPVSGGDRKTLSLFWWSLETTTATRTQAEFAQ